MHSLSGNILLYSWLKIHGLNHIGIKDYKCITCCKWLSYTGDLQTHRLNRGVQHIYALPVRRNLFILVTWRLINSQYTGVKNNNALPVWRNSLTMVTWRIIDYLKEKSKTSNTLPVRKDFLIQVTWRFVD